MEDRFWAGRRVLVTGHTGFKGAWLCLWLEGLGARVTGFALPPPTTPSLYEVARVGRGLTNIEGDVRDLGALRAAVEATRPEIVFHLAAQSLVRRSYADPVETYATNVLGTVHLLEAIRQVSGVRVVVNVTSDKCYENRDWVWGYRENDPLGGADPYSSSKGCAELVTEAYRRSFFDPRASARHGVAVASVRAGNVIGGGDWADDRLVPDIMRALLESRPVRLRNPHAVRPWQHVLEPVGAYLLLAARLWEDGARYACAWNIGPDPEALRPVGWIADRLAQLCGAEAAWETDDGPHPHEARYLGLDCARAKAELGYRPRMDVDTALKWVAAWYRGLRSGDDMRSVTEAQIDEFRRMQP